MVKATFEDIAKNILKIPISSQGGDLGFAKRGTYVPEFEATVYSIDKGEISDIIESEFGFHFIELLERRGNAVKARHVFDKTWDSRRTIELKQKCFWIH